VVDFFSCHTGGWAGMLLHRLAQRMAEKMSKNQSLETPQQHLNRIEKVLEHS